METTNFSEQLKEQILQRQKGMCSVCGKKVTETEETIEFGFHLFSPECVPTDILSDDLIMICKVCHDSATKNEGGNGNLLLKKYDYPYASFTQYGYEDLVKDIRDDINHFLGWTKDNTDFRLIRILLRDNIQLVKNHNLSREHVEELMVGLNQLSEELNKRQFEENAKFEEEANENYAKLKEKVDQAIEFAADASNFNKARENLIAAQNEFKDLKLRKSQREELFLRLNQAFEELSHRQMEEREKYEMECIENYHNLKNRIDEALISIENSQNFSKSRETLIDAQNSFKGLKLKKEQREEQYLRIQEAFDDLNKRQSEERKKYDIECEENFINLNKMVDESIVFVENSTDFKEARETLINAQKTIKGFKLNRTQRDDLYAKIRVVFDDLNKRQTEERKIYDKESGENYSRLVSKLENAIADMQVLTDFRHIREILIAIQSEVMIVNLKKERRNELFTKIREAFATLDTRRNEYRDLKKKEKMDKLQSILINLDGKAQRIDESILRDKDALNFQNEKLNEPSTPEKDEDYLNEIRTKIQSIEERIKDKESSLSEIKQRILDIQTELNTEN